MPGGLREFDFTTGVETAVIPTSPTPTVGDDLTNKTYVDSNFAALGVGGVNLEWHNGTAPSPTEDTEFNNRVFKFQDNVQQDLYAQFVVPADYIAGQQINLLIDAYSPSTSLTVKMQAIATLIRSNNDAMDSTTNQHTSTNAAVTNAVTANRHRRITLDLSTAAGLINAVAISAGDIIKVDLDRDFGNDTDTADTRMLPGTSEVNYNV